MGGEFGHGVAPVLAFLGGEMLEIGFERLQAGQVQGNAPGPQHLFKGWDRGTFGGGKEAGKKGQGASISELSFCPNGPRSLP